MNLLVVSRKTEGSVPYGYGTQSRRPCDAVPFFDLRKVDRSTLRDRSTVRIDPEASTEERIRAWIEQLGNPYVYLDGGVVVKLSFADKGETIEDRINSLYLAGA